VSSFDSFVKQTGTLTEIAKFKVHGKFSLILGEFFTTLRPWRTKVRWIYSLRIHLLIHAIILRHRCSKLVSVFLKPNTLSWQLNGEEANIDIHPEVVGFSCNYKGFYFPGERNWNWGKKTESNFNSVHEIHIGVAISKTFLGTFLCFCLLQSSRSL